MARALKQANGVVAEGEDEKWGVFTQQRQQRLDVEVLARHHQVRGSQWQAITAAEPLRQEKGQAIALLLPEGGIVEQPPRRLHKRAGFRSAQS
jgi:hypothetical protein